MLVHALARLAVLTYPAALRRACGEEMLNTFMYAVDVVRARHPFAWPLIVAMTAVGDVMRAKQELNRPGLRTAGRSGRDPRDRRGRSVIEDARYALRTFRRSPTFFGGLILVLALGIGANVSVFSLVHAVILAPLPYERPDEIVMVWRSLIRPDGATRQGVTTAHIVGWRDASPEVLSGLAAIKSWAGNLEAQLDLVRPDGAERLRGALVTPNFFDVLGATPAVGRLFTAADERRGERALVVISHALWERAFGADPGIAGRSVTFTAGRSDRGPKPFTVVGVLPKAFKFTYPLDTQIWVMQPWADIERDNGRAITHNGAVGRLRQGVTMQAAQARLLGSDPPPRAGTRPEDHVRTRLESIADSVHGPARPSMLLLSGVAVLLLFIACGTVASALFVRVAERQRELAVRTALGASRGRVLRQLLTEGLALSIAGTAAGLGVALGLLPALKAVVPALVPRGNEIGVNFWLFGFAAACVGVITLLGAMAPAWRGSRFDVASALKRASGAVANDRSSARWRRGFVGLQAALASGLLLSASLLLLSFWRLNHMPLGFDGTDVITVEMRLLDRKYRPAGLIEQFQRDLVSSVRAVPGVLDVGVTTAVPFRGVDFTWAILKPDGSGRRAFGNGRTVDPAYFSIMRIRPLRGRLLEPTDTADSPRVAVLSESMAKQLFGDEDPLGRAVDFEPPVTIVGVVPDLRYKSLDQAPSAAAYMALAQDRSELLCLVIRAAPGAGHLGNAIQHAIRSVDPAVPAMNLTTIDTIINESVSDRRFYAAAATTFAGLALVLTMAGLVVVISRTVAERRKELAIRTTLGAPAHRLIALVMREGMVPVIAGVVLGLTGAFWGASLIRQFLFQVDARGPLAYAGIGSIVIAVALLACLIPATRATRVQPASLLRAE